MLVGAVVILKDNERAEETARWRLLLQYERVRITTYRCNAQAASPNRKRKMVWGRKRAEEGLLAFHRNNRNMVLNTLDKKTVDEFE